MARRSPFTLVDLERRVVKYLRVSVTDRCNYRCTYCMPVQGVKVAPRSELCSFEELRQLVEVFVKLGVSKVRLTGGEPLARRGVVDLVRQLASIDGIDDLAMTTNAHLLADLAQPLADAGLTRLNVSLDSLDPAVFAKITRLGTLEPVLRGLQAAKDAGIGPIKINAVILRGVNDGEICDLLDFAADNGYVLRFIEYMPIGLDDYWGPNSFVPHAEIRERLSEKWSVRPADDRPRLGGGPAVPMLADRLDGRYVDVPVGFISALSHNFCRSCNRVRLSAIGTLRECLSTGGVLSLRDMLRNGDGPADLERSIRLALAGKVDGHRFHQAQGTPEAMSSIGG
jgi:GTP 3',8-cyclase